MTVVLKDFWPSHKSDYQPNFSGDVTKEFLKDLVSQIAIPGGKPIVVTSVYKNHSIFSQVLRKIVSSSESKNKMLYQGNFSTKPSENSFNIWYTAENIRPLLDSGYDAYLSYDLDSFLGVNYYLPLWLCRLGPTTEKANQIQYSLTQKRSISSIRSKNFAVVASNPEQIRGHFIKSLKKYENVEIFGKLGKQIANKNLTLNEFNFNICFENDLYPGYVTEKAIEAYLSGCIPVWRGVDAGQFLNRNAIIDVTNMTVVEAVREVLRVSKDPELMIKMRSAPLLRKTIKLEQLVADLRKRYLDQ